MNFEEIIAQIYSFRQIVLEKDGNLFTGRGYAIPYNKFETTIKLKMASRELIELALEAYRELASEGDKIVVMVTGDELYFNIFYLFDTKEAAIEQAKKKKTSGLYYFNTHLPNYLH